MEILKNVLIVLHLVITAVLIIVVLLQESKSKGLSSTLTGSTDTFFGKNGGGTYDAIMRRWTAVAATLFLVTSLALTFLLK